MSMDSVLEKYLLDSMTPKSVAGFVEDRLNLKRQARDHRYCWKQGFPKTSLKTPETNKHSWGPRGSSAWV